MTRGACEEVSEPQRRGAHGESGEHHPPSRPTKGRRPGPGGAVGGRRRLRNWRRRTKVGAVLLVPTIAALVLGGLRVQTEIDNANNFHRTVAQVDVAKQITEVVHQLQRERVLMVTGSAANSSAAGSPLATQLDR